MAKLIIDLDELNFGNLFKAGYERTGNVIQSTVRLAIPRQINIHTAIGGLNFTITGKSIGDHR